MQPEEYSIAVWKNGECKLNLCVPHGHSVTSPEHAARWGYHEAIKRNVVGVSQPCDVDVSVDASDDWQTFSVPFSAVIDTADGELYTSPRR